MNDKEHLQYIRALMTLIVHHQETTAALMMTLKAQGLINPMIFEAQLREAQKLWLPAREKVEKIGTEEAQSIEEFLKNFEGPLQ